MSVIDDEAQAIAEELRFFPDWEERYAHLIDLGRALPDLPEAARQENNRVRGCASQVWIIPEKRAETPDLIFFLADSDSHLVRGLIAIVLRLFSGRRPQDILAADPQALFQTIGLSGALTPQRANGLASLVTRLREQARGALGESL